MNEWHNGKTKHVKRDFGGGYIIEKMRKDPTMRAKVKAQFEA